MKEYITKSPKETKKLAKQVVANLKGGEVLGLVGELGAGKTVFVQGLAEALKVKEIVNSPTFVLMKVYDTQDSAIHQLIHVDAYRLESYEELKSIGIEEYINKKDCLVVIEWADKVNDIRKKQQYQEIIFEEGKKESERVVKTNNTRTVHE